MYRFFLFSLMLLLLSSCSSSGSPEGTVGPSALPFSTATLMPTFTPRPSATQGSPTVAATIEPLEGIANTQINVRAGPDQGQPSLGLLSNGTKLQIIGKDISEKWWQIIYAASPSGVGWVTVAFVQFQGDIDKVPVIQAVVPGLSAPVGPSTPGATGDLATATLPAPTSSARTASVTQKINVRSGPATAYESLGMIEPNTIVTLTGRNENNIWVQIEFTGGPDGKGWVAALYLKDANLNGLPYYDNQGKLLSSPTALAPGQPSLTPTAFSAAVADGDSESKPAVRQTFSPEGVGALTYSSELSAPDGDDADWVAFTPYEPTNQSTYVYLRLDCIGNGGVTAILEKDGKPVPDVPHLACGNYDFAMKVLGGTEYMLVLHAEGSGSTLRYIKYTLTIKVKR